MLVVVGVSWLAIGRAEAQQTFQIDVYVPAIPVEGEADFTIQMPLVAGSDGVLRGSVARVPGTAFDSSTIIPFDPTWPQDNADLKSAIDAAFAAANAKFKAAGVQFKVRTIYVVSARHKTLTPPYDAESETFRLDVTTGRSRLLQSFTELTAANGSAFRMFLAPIDGGVSGMAQTPGTVSVIDFSAAVTPNMNGFGLVHELAHNLGVPQDAHRPERRNHALSERVPNLRGNQQADPALEPNEVAIIRENAGHRRYANTRLPTSSESAEDKKSKASPAQDATTPKAKKRSATRKKVRARKPAATTSKQPGHHSTGSSAAIIEFGLDVGSGFIRQGRGHGDRQRHDNQR
jgi:hypothetical protein